MTLEFLQCDIKKHVISKLRECNETVDWWA